MNVKELRLRYQYTIDSSPRHKCMTSQEVSNITIVKSIIEFVRTPYLFSLILNDLLKKETCAAMEKCRIHCSSIILHYS